MQKRSIFFILFSFLFLGACNGQPNLPKENPTLAKKVAECAKLPPTKDAHLFYQQYRKLLRQRKWFTIVDKTHLLSKDYEPKDLVYHPPFPLLRKEVLSQLEKMYQAAKKENILIEAFSGYRSFLHQQILNEKDPNSPFLAKPGTSQHHLGTAIDFEINYKESNPPTPIQIWLEKHASEYGFSLSYPRGAEEETGYPYEPWHYRYITKEGVIFQNEFFGGSQHKMLYFWEQCPPENFVNK